MCLCYFSLPCKMLFHCFFDFWDYNTITFPSPLKPSYIPLLALSKVWPLFSFIITCVCIYVPKYNLFSLYNVTFVCVFRANRWVLCKHLQRSPRGRLSPALSIPYCLQFLCRVEVLSPLRHIYCSCSCSAHVWAWLVMLVRLSGCSFWHY